MLENVAQSRSTPQSRAVSGTQGRSKSTSAGRAQSTSGRKKSKLTQVGDEASKLARRSVLLATLDACKWNLTRAAEVLEMVGASDIIRAIKELDLETEYEAAKERGDVAKRRDNTKED